MPSGESRVSNWKFMKSTKKLSNPTILKEVGISPWVIWGFAATFFFCEYFIRVAPAVMGLHIAQDLRLDAAELGYLSSFFYWPYVLMQVPVGMLVDRYNTRYLLTLMAVFTCLGGLLFAGMHSVWVGALSRALIGFSAAFAFVGALKLAATWFPPQRLGLLASMTQALGMLGALVGQAPVAFALTIWGWRHTLIVMSMTFALLAVGLFLFVRDKAKVANHKNLSLSHSLKIVIQNPQSWLNGIYVGLLFAPTEVFGELWGNAYLQHVLYFTKAQAAWATGMIFLGWGIGGPFMGWLSDRLRRRRPLMTGSAVLCCILLSSVLFIPNISYGLVCVLLFGFGIANTGVGLAYAVAGEINEPAVAGTSMAFANMFSVIIGACLQPILGFFIDYIGGKSSLVSFDSAAQHAFKVTMIILPIVLILAIVFAQFVKETFCRNVTMVKA